MFKNSASKMNEFDKLNNMKDKLKNSKTLNLSQINKNIIRSNNNSEKNILRVSPRNEIIIINSESKNTYNHNKNDNKNKNIILIDSNENNIEGKELKYSDAIRNIDQSLIKESDIAIYEKNKNIDDKNYNLINCTNKCLEADPHRYIKLINNLRKDNNIIFKKI